METLLNPTPEQTKVLNRWRTSTFWVMLLGYIGYYICRGNLSTALPLLSETFHYSNTELGIILTLSEFAYAVGKFTTGPLADYLGGKKIFLLGMLGAILFNVLFPFFSSIFAFTVIWCLCRYFLSMGWGGIIKTIGEWYEAERNGTIMGLISINFQFGSGVASIFCGFLIAMGVGWRGLFFYPAAVLFVIFLWSYFCSKGKPQDVYPNIRFGKNASQKKSIANLNSQEEHSGWHIVKKLFAIDLFRKVLIFSFMMHLSRSIFVFWITKFLFDLGMGKVNAAFMSAVFPLLGAVGTIWLGWYTDNHAKNGDRARMMWIMLLGLVISQILIAMLVPYGLKYQYWIVFLLGLSGFFLNGPYSMSAGCLSLDIAGPEGAGSCTGIIDGIGYFGGAFAAWAAGYMSDKLGWSQVFIMLAGFALLAVFAAYSMSRTFQRRAKKEAF